VIWAEKDGLTHEKWWISPTLAVISYPKNGDFSPIKMVIPRRQMVISWIKKGGFDHQTRGFNQDLAKMGDSGNLSILKWWYHWDIIYIYIGLVGGLDEYDGFFDG